MRKWLVVVGLVILGGGQTYAQLLTPLTNQPLRVIGQFPSAKSETIPGVLAEGDPLALPFIDDFSQSEGRPDPARWERTGGVYTSNRYARAPRTIFAATFDGLKADGQPYGSANAVGPTDTLTSRPLLLGNLQPQDSLYLSFYWQAGGLLDAPNFSSATTFYLWLEFKEANGTWTPVWTQRGNGRSTDFAPVMLPIRESKYLHDDFQFRWVSSGSQSGLRDVWHLDYVHLDRNRRLGQLQSLDVALTQRPPSLLRRYTAMPYHQFIVNPAEELRDQVGSEFLNLSALPAAISWRGFLRQLASGAVDTFMQGSSAVNAGERQSIGAPPSISFLSSQNSPFSVETTVFLNTKEPTGYTLYNDTITRRTDWLDYYAYDDGTAEAGFSYPSNALVQLAYQFEVNQPDRVKLVRIFFTGTNTPGTVLFLRLWADNGGKPTDQPVYEQRFVVPETLNEWLTIELDAPVEVQGRFYVGFRQPGGSAFVNVGYDLQENAMDKVFTTNGPGDWSHITGFEGALLLRPVMAGGLTASPAQLVDGSPILYPNPAVNYVTVGKAIDRLELYSLAGHRLKTWHNLRAGERLLLGNFPAGVYLVKTFTGTQIRTSKLILQP